MAEKFAKQFTPGIRAMVGGVLFLAGLIWQFASNKTLDMYAFYMMSAGILCFTNVLAEKMSKGTSSPIPFLLLNMAVMITGFSLSASTAVEGVVMYGIWGICVIVDWVVNAVLLNDDNDSMGRRIAFGFVTTLLNVILIGIVFMIPVLIAAFRM